MNISILSSNDCVGCGLCARVCPVKCIGIKVDALGFAYPVVNDKRCIDCGKCSNMCPVMNSPDLVYPKDVYAARSRSKSDLLHSSSGAISTVMTKKIIQSGNVAYGVVTKGLDAVYIRMQNTDEVNRIKGSKYIQSDLSTVYDTILEDLVKNRVLFVGTPCEVAAMINFTGNHKNLITVSFPCGGWSNSKLLEEEVSHYVKLNRIDHFSMRDRHSVFISVCSSNKEIAHISIYKSRFMASLDSKAAIRKSCWNCYWSRKERVGDISIGDFWGLQPSNTFSEQDISDGVSLICVQSIKGRDFLKEIEPEIIIEKKEYRTACKYNKRLVYPVVEDKAFSISMHERFYRYYPRLKLYRTVNKCLFSFYYSRRIRGCIRSIIKRIKGDKK